MDVSIIRGMQSLFEWAGIKLQPYDVLLLIGIAFVAFVLSRLSRVEIRLKMHADHFDVLDETHSQATKDSSKALENSSYAKGSVDTLISMAKKIKP